MECSLCKIKSWVDAAQQDCSFLENEGMVPLTHNQIGYNSHVWVKEWPFSEVDITCHPEDNLSHMKYVLEGYRDRVVGDEHTPDGIGRKYSPGSARDISWTTGWKKADDDLTKVIVSGVQRHGAVA
jgi:hypothetical protein